MGGSGASPLPRDLSRLTPREREAYDWAIEEIAAGRYPGVKAFSRYRCISFTMSRMLVAAVHTKVGWPCPLRPTFCRRSWDKALSPQQARALRWANLRKVAGQSIVDADLAAYLVVSKTRARQVRQEVARKVGWPGVTPRRPSGVHGLTPGCRQVLTLAWDLWESRPREYPSLRVLASLLGHKHIAQVAKARSICIEKGIWPCKSPHRGHVPLTSSQTEFILDGFRRGLPRRAIVEQFKIQFNRKIHIETVSRVLLRSGVVSRRGHRDGLTMRSRRDSAIRERGGMAPAKLEDPSAFRRAVRAARRARSSSSKS
jgi:hypothetical protein